MRSEAYVVHTGVITSIGNDTSTCKAALMQGKSGISKADYLPTVWRDEFPVGEVKLCNESLAALSGMSPLLPRTALLSAVAVKEAWSPFQENSNRLRVGFFSANTVGGMDVTERYYAEMNDQKNFSNIEHIKYHECGAVTSLVANHFQLTGFITTISTACSSSANSIMMATQMIQNDLTDVAIAGGADCLSLFTLNGFHTLMILDKEPCQPFDENRRGLNLGEGAGYLVLMNERALRHYNASALCRVSGYANANDAYHQTASSPEGAGNKLAMQKALRTAGLHASEIDYINLHGTGTANNDSSEGKAIEEVFQGSVPPASSTKAFTGHTLGGCGGVESVFSVLAITEGAIFPNLRWEHQMAELSWKPQSALKVNQNIRHVLSNSFGFGGNCSSLIFSKDL